MGDTNPEVSRAVAAAHEGLRSASERPGIKPGGMKTVNNSERSDERTEEIGRAPRRLVVLAVLVLAGVTWWTLGEQQQADPHDGQQRSERAAMLSGQVVDDVGRPVAAARVSAGESEVTANEHGEFSFRELAPGTHHLDVLVDDYTWPGRGDQGRATVSLEPEETAEGIELVVQRPASVSGRVVANGEGVEGVTVSLSYLEAPGIEGTSLDPFVVEEAATTGDDGRFTLTDISPGRLEVVADDGEGYAESEPIELQPGEESREVLVDLQPTGVLEGQVVDEGGEPLDAELTMIPAYTDDVSHQFQLTEGDFRIEQLEEGGYALEVDAEGFRTERLEAVSVPSGSTTSVQVQLEESAGLVGRVVQPDATPVDSARVTVSRDGESHHTETDAEGRFQFEELTSGSWRAVANSPHHDPSAPTPIEAEREITLELQPGAVIAGRVVDHNRRAVDEFSVAVEFLEIHGEDHQHARRLDPVEVRDRRGRFEVGPVPQGRYRLVVDVDDAPGVVTEPVEVDTGRATIGPVTIELDAGTEVAGVVRDAHEGSPIEGARVIHDDPSAEDNPVTYSDAEGFYRLEALPSGIQRLRVEHDDYVTELLDGVRIPEGGRLDYDVELVEAAEDRSGFARYETGAIFGTDDGYPEVVAIAPDSPARRSELEVGDVVEAVDGMAVDEMTTDEVLQRVRGDSATPAVLEVRRPGRGPMTIEVPRQRQFIATGQ